MLWKLNELSAREKKPLVLYNSVAVISFVCAKTHIIILTYSTSTAAHYRQFILAKSVFQLLFYVQQQRWSKVTAELQYNYSTSAMQGFHYTGHPGTEGDSPVLLPCTVWLQGLHMIFFTLKNMYITPVYKKSFQWIRLTRLLITPTLLRISSKVLRSSPSCRKKLIKRANVAIP